MVFVFVFVKRRVVNSFNWARKPVGDLHLDVLDDVVVAKISGKDIGPGLDIKDPTKGSLGYKRSNKRNF